jgi:uncharacterized protein (TIGR02145 family)
MMKTILKMTMLLLLVSSGVYAQVGIGTTTPDASATLEIASTTKGLLLPRLTTMQRDAIVTPAQGLMIYCIDCGSGEISFFNGSIWSGSPVFTVPGAPVIGAATAGNGQATVSYTAPAANGGSVITGYTATSSPWGITGTLSQGGSGVITVTGLPNGPTYTFTITATNAIGTSTASAASNSVTSSVPLVTTEVPSDNSGGTFTFLSHNLGADYSLDPHTPVVGLQGGYVQWGKPGPTNWVGAANDGANGFAAAPTASEANEASVSSWSRTLAADGSWNSGTEEAPSKTANDPCPTGYRVPTRNEWVAVHANNIFSKTGPFSKGNTQYGSAIHYGSAMTPKLLTLPAAGLRNSTNGALDSRGNLGFYWTSTEDAGDGSYAYRIFFDDSRVYPNFNGHRLMGFSVRCLAE